jgi:integrase
MVGDFYLSLTDEGGIQSAATQWNAVAYFMKSLGDRLSKFNAAWKTLTTHLTTFGEIRHRSNGNGRPVRALPDVTMNALLQAAHPESESNPFHDKRVRWRNWLIVHLLLLCGLRRGEMLLLVIDSLKRDINQSTGAMTYWLNVTNTEKEDERAYRPSIKTLDSHRQIPVSETLATLYEHYVAEARVESDVAFLLTSERGRALSAESVTKMFEALTAALPEPALNSFRQRTSGKRHISPHDLRHTCAAAKYSFYMEVEPDRELTFQRLREFFGWSAESTMPDLYAKAAIEDDVFQSWSNAFDVRVEGLRGLGR